MHDVVLRAIDESFPRHVTQFEELELLKEFEKQEINFLEKYQTKKKERVDIEKKVMSLYYYVA